MFYAWDIAEFREAIKVGDLKGEYKRLRYSRERVEVHSSNATSHSVAAPMNVTMTAPSRIFGKPIKEECLDGVGNYVLPVSERTLQEIHGGSVIGLSAALDDAGRLYAPERIASTAALTIAQKRNLSNAEGYVLEATDEGAYAYFFCGGERKRHAGSALFITNLEIGNYGSFLVRMLPQLIALKQAGRNFDCYIVSDRQTWFQDALRLLDLPDLPIFTVREICGDIFDTILMFNVCDTEGLLSAEIARGLRSVVEKVQSGGNQADIGKRIYVSRTLSRIGSPHYRPLTDELAIESMMRQRGYSILYPETLPFERQISAFANAERVIGPSGSGMLNAIFSKPGTRVVDCESYTVAVRQHAKTYSSTGKVYAFCFGEVHAHDGDLSLAPWRIPRHLLEEAASWLDRP